MPQSEPRNPFYFSLLLVSLLFVLTALAYAVVPVLEEKAALAGQAPAPSPFRDALRKDGWIWLLAEVAALILFSFLSMGLDRLRSLRKERQAATIPESETDISSR
ncbi:MAG: hypothetical protein ACJ8FY_25930 [Gemmataceae bacterium]